MTTVVFFAIVSRDFCYCEKMEKEERKEIDQMYKTNK